VEADVIDANTINDARKLMRRRFGAALSDDDLDDAIQNAVVQTLERNPELPKGYFITVVPFQCLNLLTARAGVNQRRAWDASHPEAVRAHRRKRWDRLKADPIRHAAYLERRRDYWREKAREYRAAKKAAAA
jgi:hypothetical protein